MSPKIFLIVAFSILALSEAIELTKEAQEFAETVDYFKTRARVPSSYSKPSSPVHKRQANKIKKEKDNKRAGHGYHFECVDDCGSPRAKWGDFIPEWQTLNNRRGTTEEKDLENEINAWVARLIRGAPLGRMDEDQTPNYFNKHWRLLDMARNLSHSAAMADRQGLYEEFRPKFVDKIVCDSDLSVNSMLSGFGTTFGYPDWCLSHIREILFKFNRIEEVILEMQSEELEQGFRNQANNLFVTGCTNAYDLEEVEFTESPHGVDISVDSTSEYQHYCFMYIIEMTPEVEYPNCLCETSSFLCCVDRDPDMKPCFDVGPDVFLVLPEDSFNGVLNYTDDPFRREEQEARFHVHNWATNIGPEIRDHEAYQFIITDSPDWVKVHLDPVTGELRIYLDSDYNDIAVFNMTNLDFNVSLKLRRKDVRGRYGWIDSEVKSFRVYLERLGRVEIPEGFGPFVLAPYLTMDEPLWDFNEWNGHGRQELYGFENPHLAISEEDKSKYFSQAVVDPAGALWATIYSHEWTGVSDIDMSLVRGEVQTLDIRLAVVPRDFEGVDPPSTTNNLPILPIRYGQQGDSDDCSASPVLLAGNEGIIEDLSTNQVGEVRTDGVFCLPFGPQDGVFFAMARYLDEEGRAGYARYLTFKTSQQRR